MLILSRKIGESIIIGGETEVTILELSGDKVRVGVNAPKNISVLRSELKKTEEEDKSAAASVSPVKLAEYKTHIDPPGINGTLVEGRIYYDAFVLTNKANGIVVHKNA